MNNLLIYILSICIIANNWAVCKNQQSYKTESPQSSLCVLPSGLSLYRKGSTMSNQIPLKNEVRELYLAGLSAVQISTEIKIDKSCRTINRWMQNEGISRKSGGSDSKWPEFIHQKAIQLYEMGMTSQEIGKHLGNVKPITIYSWITKAGITKRPIGWHLKGKRNCNWKGGSQRTSDRVSERYKSWRLQVYERDNFSCVCCRETGDNLEAHHILSFAQYPQYRFVIENGVTLCQDCHYKLHGRNRRRCINE